MYVTDLFWITLYMANIKKSCNRLQLYFTLLTILSVTRRHCCPTFNDKRRVLMYDMHLSFLKLGIYGVAIAHPQNCFCPSVLLSEYLTDHVAIGVLYVRFVFSIRLLYTGLPGCAIDSLCRVQCRKLATCLLYVRSPFVNLVLNNSWYVSFTWRKRILFVVLLLLYVFTYILYININLRTLGMWSSPSRDVLFSTS